MKLDTYKLLFILCTLNIVLSIGIVSYGGVIFSNGFHNADLGQNFRYINAKEGTNYLDIASDYVIYSPEELYILGINQQKLGLFYLCAGFFLFGLALGILTRFTPRKLQDYKPIKLPTPPKPPKK